MWSSRQLLTTLILTLVLVFSLLVAAQAASPQGTAPPFTDVDAAEPNLPFVNYLVNRQMLAGFPDGTFRPAEPLTRAQAAAFMARAAGLETDGITNTSFSDVNSGHWAFQVIGAAQRAGYLKGFPGGTFRPNEALTRAQAAALVMRLAGAGVPETPLPVPADLPPGHWGANAVAAGLDAGIVTRRDANQFAPNEPFTRLEMARALALGVTLSPDTREVPLAGLLVPKKGVVKLKKAGEAAYRVITTEEAVGSGDHIQTGTESLAELLFEDGTGVLLQSGVRLGIAGTRGLAYVRWDGEPGVAVERLEMDLQAGRIFTYLSESYRFGKTAGPVPATGPGGANAGPPAPRLLNNGALQPVLLAQQGAGAVTVPWWKQPQEKRVRVQVNMPYGVAGVRGSTVSFAVLPDGRMEISNLSGDVFVQSGTVIVDIPPKFATVVAALGEVQLPQGMTIEQLARFIEAEVQAFLQQQAAAAEDCRAVQQQPGDKPGEQTGAGEPNLLDQIRALIMSVEETVTALPPPPPPAPAHSGPTPVAVTGITLNKSILDLDEGDTAILTAFIEPANATNKTVSWVSSNPAVATVSAGGLVTAVAPGVVTVTAVAQGGVNKYAECTVVVYEVRELGEMNLGEPVPLEESATPVRLRATVTVGDGDPIELALGVTSIGPGVTLTVAEPDPGIVPPGEVPFLGLDITLEPFSGQVLVQLSLPDGLAGEEAGAFHYNAEDGVWEYRAATVDNGTISFRTELSPVGVSRKVGVPLNLQADYAGLLTVYLTWGSVSQAVYYQVYRDGVKIAFVERPEHTDAGLLSGTTYRYSVAAVNEYGFASARSAELEVTIVATSGSVTGVVRNAQGYSLTGATVSLIGDQGPVAGTSTGQDGHYHLSWLPGTGYTLEFSADGYAAEVYYDLEIVEDVVRNLGTVRLAVYTEVPGGVSGRVVNALTGGGVEDLTLVLRRGLNATTGDPAATTVTGWNGEYEVAGLAAGNYTVEVSGEGYTTAHFTALCLGDESTNGNQNGTVSPVLGEGEIRIVLTWGEHPRDLDAHLTGPAADESGTLFQVCYWNDEYFYDDILYASLDQDVTGSYGPETITIHRQTPGVYRYYVHDYTNRSASPEYPSAALAQSGARVDVYTQAGLVAVFHVPDQPGNLWEVFAYDGETFTVVNQVTYGEPDFVDYWGDYGEGFGAQGFQAGGPLGGKNT